MAVVIKLISNLCTHCTQFWRVTLVVFLILNLQSRGYHWRSEEADSCPDWYQVGQDCTEEMVRRPSSSVAGMEYRHSLFYDGLT